MCASTKKRPNLILVGGYHVAFGLDLAEFTPRRLGIAGLGTLSTYHDLMRMSEVSASDERNGIRSTLVRARIIAML